jgi:hypothetical protein
MNSITRSKKLRLTFLAKRGLIFNSDLVSDTRVAVVIIWSRVL